MGSTKYITSMGELSRKDNSLCFRKNGKNIYIPIENTKEIYCLNEVSFNSKLLDFLGRNNLDRACFLGIFTSLKDAIIM